MRVSKAFAVLAMVAVATGAVLACSTFGSAEDGPTAAPDATRDETGGADGPTVQDGGADSADAASADACSLSFIVNETFEDPTFPPLDFEVNVSNSDSGTGSVARSSTAGVDGGAGFSSQVFIKDANEGPRARLDRTFEVVPSGIVMELDVRPPTGPTTAGLYSQLGCALLLYGSALRDGDPLRTELTLVSNSGGALKLDATEQPSNKLLKSSGQTGPTPNGGFLHTRVRLNFAPNDMAHADFEVGAAMKSIDFKLAITAKSITLACGIIYADSTTGDFTADVDNIKLTICGSAP